MSDPVMMEPETKPWYLSKGIIGAIVVIVATVLGFIGRASVGDAVTAESSNIYEIVLAIGALVGGVLALIGRIVAKATIGSK